MQDIHITELLGDGIGEELRVAVHKVAERIPLNFHFSPIDLSLENRRLTGPSIYVSLRDVRLLNASTGAVLNVLRGHTGAIRSLAVVPSGRLLAAGSTDSTIKLWCIKGLGAGTSPATLKEHGDNIQSVAVSPSGCMLATASKDCTAKLWDITALLPEARVLALVLIGRRRRGELPHVPQELWKLTLDDFY